LGFPGQVPFLPNPDKSAYGSERNNKLQAQPDLKIGPNKFQIYNIQISNKIKRKLFGILNFSHCDLIVICLLAIAV